MPRPAGQTVLQRFLMVLGSAALLAACGGNDGAEIETDTGEAVSSRPVRLAATTEAPTRCQTGTTETEASVMAYPDLAADQVADLPAGSAIHVCERSGATTWYGVLYARDAAGDAAETDGEAAEGEAQESETQEGEAQAALPDCALTSGSSSASGDRAPGGIYRGPCASGWILARTVSLDTGEAQ